MPQTFHTHSRRNATHTNPPSCFGGVRTRRAADADVGLCPECRADDFEYQWFEIRAKCTAANTWHVSVADRITATATVTITVTTAPIESTSPTELAASREIAYGNS